MSVRVLCVAVLVAALCVSASSLDSHSAHALKARLRLSSESSPSLREAEMVTPTILRRSDEDDEEFPSGTGSAVESSEPTAAVTPKAITDPSIPQPLPPPIGANPVTGETSPAPAAAPAAGAASSSETLSPASLAANAGSATRSKIKTAEKDVQDAAAALQAARDKLGDTRRRSQQLELKGQELSARLQRKQSTLKNLQDSSARAQSAFYNLKAQSEAQRTAVTVSERKLDKMHYRDKARARRMLKMLVHLERQVSHHFKVAEAITQGKEAIKKETVYWDDIQKTVVEIPKLKRAATDAEDAAKNAERKLKRLQEKADLMQRAITEIVRRQGIVAKKLADAKDELNKATSEVDQLKAALLSKKTALAELRKQHAAEREATRK